MNMIRTHIISSAGLVLWAAACGSEIAELPPPPLAETLDATAAQCPTGGRVIRTGLDNNADGVLQDEEVVDASFVCNGPAGMDGNPGADGAVPLTSRTAEAAGENCPNGGERIDAGRDLDANGVLDAGEIESTAFVCTGPRGASGVALLTSTSTSVEGDCPDGGGTRVSVGLDDDGDGVLQPAEVDASEVVCAGETGQAEIVRVEPVPPGADCPAGGQSVTIGRDENADGVLQTEEISTQSFVCAPVSSITTVTELFPGDPDCAGGGQRIDSGLDANADGVLEAAEITSSAFACDGPNGEQVLVNRSAVPAGPDCARGGERVAYGLDADRDGILSAAEETTVSFACNGADGDPGLNGGVARTASEPAGPNCFRGGTRIETGPDANGNGVLDDSEVTNTSFSCNGEAASVLVEVSLELAGANCTDGGQRIDVGLDIDGSGSLEASEITSTAYACSNRAAVPVGFITTTLPQAVPGSSYSVPVEAIGGVGGDYAWTIVSGSLPAGLTLDPTGTPASQISGTPTTGGVSNFTIRVTDRFGNTEDRAFTLDVALPLSLSPVVLPSLEEGTAYSVNLTASGGSAPYTFSVVDSSLPAGLSLSATGVLSGTPTTPFGGRFLVEVEDNVGDTVRGAINVFGEQRFFAYCGDTITDGQNDLILVDASVPGGSSVTVTPSVANAPVSVNCDVAFSPASEKIAFVGTATTGFDGLHVVDFSAFPAVTTDTEINVPLAATLNDITEIQWSPDGDHLLYFGDVDTSLDNELYIVDVATLTNTKVNGPLVSGGDVGETDFLFTLDSSRVVYQADELTDGADELFLFDVASLTNLGRINQPLATSSDDVDDGFKVSSDSRNVLYAAEGDVAGQTDLYLVDITGNGPFVSTRVNPELVTGGDIGETNFPSDDDYDFSPAGDAIAYVADQDTDLLGQAYLVRTDSLGTATLISPSTSGSGQDAFRIQWDNLGRYVLVHGDMETGGVDELFAADSLNTGGDPLKVNGTLPSTSADVDLDFAFAPNDAYVVFEADQRVAQNEEVNVAFVSDFGTGTVSSPLGMTFSDGITGIKFASDGSGFICAVNTETVSTFSNELFYTAVSPPTVSASVRVNTALTTAGQDVDTSDLFMLRNGRNIAYISDELVDNEQEVFLVDTAAGVVGTRTQLTSLPVDGIASSVIVQEF